MKEMLKLGAILLVITSIAAGLLALANDKTSGTIADLTAKKNNESRMDIFKDAKSFKEIDKKTLSDIQSKHKDVQEVFEALDSSNKVIGYTVKTATAGYADKIEVTTGISIKGEITGVSVGNNSETPGLGSKAAEPAFQNQFNNQLVKKKLEVVKSAPEKGQIQALTGATITSEGVTVGVNTAIEAFNMLNGGE